MSLSDHFYTEWINPKEWKEIIQDLIDDAEVIKAITKVKGVKK